MPEASAAPQARREPHPTTLHGRTLQDDYAWLRDKQSPEVLAYLEAENAYTAAAMAATAPLQARLYQEMLSHIKETDESVPYRDNGWWYLSRTFEGKQYAQYTRRRDEPDAPEDVLLDVNLLAEGQAFMAVGALALSPDNRLLAYTTDSTGFRQYTLHLRDLSDRQSTFPAPSSASARSPGPPTPRPSSTPPRTHSHQAPR